MMGVCQKDKWMENLASLTMDWIYVILFNLFLIVASEFLLIKLNLHSLYEKKELIYSNNIYQNKMSFWGGTVV